MLEPQAWELAILPFLQKTMRDARTLRWPKRNVNGFFEYFVPFFYLFRQGTA
jgi:hypothetical protein